MKRRALIGAGGAVLLAGAGALVHGADRAAAASGAASKEYSAGKAESSGGLTRKEIFYEDGAPVLGNPKGTLPIAEYYDYRCPYCRRMHPLFTRLLAKNADIRFVSKQWPIFGGVSVTAARVAMASAWQGKFAAVNDKLFTTDLADEDSVMQAARQAGADMDRLAKDLKARAEDLHDELGTVALQADALGFQGTPGLIIGSYLIPGALSAKDLADVVRDARAKLAKSKG